MCRLVAYIGRPIPAADIVTRPQRSIIRQSYDARERVSSAGEFVPASLNGDGCGVGWFSASGEPCVFRSVRPGWSDTNLRHLAERGVSSRVIFAHVRAATAGTSVDEKSCHPFQYGRYLWMHNGMVAGWERRVRRALLEQLNDECYDFAVRNGASDSVVAFALFLNQMRDGADAWYPVDELRRMLERTLDIIVRTCVERCGERGVSLLNFVVSDGRALLATRFAHSAAGAADAEERVEMRASPPAASLYFGAAANYKRVGDDFSMLYGARRSGLVVVTSEPLTDSKHDWVPVPYNSVLVVTPDLHLLLSKIRLNAAGGISEAGATAEDRLSRALEHLLTAGAGSGDGRGREAAPAEPTALRAPDAVLRNHSDYVQCLAATTATADGYVLSGAQDGFLCVWDPRRRARLDRVRIAGAGRSVLGVLPLHDARQHLVTTSTDNIVRVWNTLRRPFTLTAELATGRMGHPLAMASCGRWLYLGFQDTSVQALSVDGLIEGDFDASPLVQFGAGAADDAQQHCGPVFSLVFDARTMTLFSGAGDGCIKAWDVGTRRCKRTLRGHRGAVLALAVDSERGCLYSGSRDGALRVWDISSEAAYICKRTLAEDAHADDVTAIALSTRYVFSASADGHVLVWRRKDLSRAARIVVPGATPSIQTLLASGCGGGGGGGGGNDEAAAHETLYAAGYCDVFTWDIGSALERGTASPAAAAASPRTPLESALDPHFATGFDAALRAAVRFQSVSGVDEPFYRDECFRCAKFFAGMMERMGASVSLAQPFEARNPVVFGRFEQAGREREAPTVLFYGHYDVVPAHPLQGASGGADADADAGGWRTDPFELSVIDGYYYGRGCTDNKGPTLCMLFAISELLESGGLADVNVAIVLDGEEESDSAGLREAVSANARAWVGPDVLFILQANSLWIGDDRPCITFGMRGSVAIDVQVAGPSRNLHSGFEGGAVVEPVHDLVSVLGALVDARGRPTVPAFFDGVIAKPSAREQQCYDDIEFDAEAYRRKLGVRALSSASARDVLMARWRQPCISITNVTTSNTTHSASVIPMLARATVSIRTVPEQEPERVRDAVQRHMRAEFRKRDSPNALTMRCTKSGDWWHGDVHAGEGGVFGLVEQALTQVWGGTRPLYVREGGSMPLTRWLEREFQAPAVHLPLGQASDAPHLPNERVRCWNLERGKEALKLILMNAGACRYASDGRNGGGGEVTRR